MDFQQVLFLNILQFHFFPVGIVTNIFFSSVLGIDGRRFPACFVTVFVDIGSD